MRFWPGSLASRVAGCWNWQGVGLGRHMGLGGKGEEVDPPKVLGGVVEGYEAKCHAEL